MRIGVPAEIRAGETRVAATPETELRREIWVDASGKVARFNLAFINREIYRGDNGRVLGYDSQHGVWHRHHLGEVSPVDVKSFAEVEAMFEAEVQAYLRSERR